ncbi:MAG: PHP domain-containing protein [Chloroflexi bacterium]|nr:PHP domain-containing protein [Chloroflexota bacterium]
MLRAELHCHTCYSPDSASSLEDVVRQCQKVGVDCLAVTDHNCLHGALRLRDMAPFLVIPGEEIKSSEGEIIGLFLGQEVPRGLSPQETVARIKGQGGLVYVPHPFSWRASGLAESALEAILPSVDVVEVFNARNNIFRGANRKAETFARQHGLTVAAASDAHLLSELGRSGVVMPEFDGPQGFLRSLTQATMVRAYSPVWVHAWSVGRRLLRGGQNRRPSCPNEA